MDENISNSILIILIILLLLAIGWTLYLCFCKSLPKTLDLSDTINVKDPEIPKDSNDPNDPNDPILPNTETPSNTETCPHYAYPGVYIVQSCDANTHNYMSDRQWAIGQDPHNFSYLPATSIPQWTQFAQVNQAPLYTLLQNASAGLDTDLTYQDSIPSNYWPLSESGGYLLGDANSAATVEDLYADYWVT